jgi:hypothetical protein
MWASDKESMKIPLKQNIDFDFLSSHNFAQQLSIAR